jgi:hypothetical protein
VQRAVVLPNWRFQWLLWRRRGRWSHAFSRVDHSYHKRESQRERLGVLCWNFRLAREHLHSVFLILARFVTYFSHKCVGSGLLWYSQSPDGDTLGGHPSIKSTSIQLAHKPSMRKCLIIKVINLQISIAKSFC